MQAADVIATRLFQAGCRYAFGIPGGEVLTIIDALQRAGIEVVLTKHENAAGFMAEGMYHATGAPGILIATVGPGIANAVDSIANAFLERVPLIVISGCIDAAERLTYTHQVFNHAEVLRTIVKATFEAIPNACDVMIDKALAIATDDRPGPVHIDLPIAVAASDHTQPAGILRKPIAISAPSEGPELADAREMFARAKRPVIIAGVDVLSQPDAKNAIRAFSQRFNVPVATTYKAKGIVDEHVDFCLGGHGISPRSDEIILDVLARADMVISIGYDPIEMRYGWRNPWRPVDAIEFVSAPNLHYMHHVKHSWVCNFTAALRELARADRKETSWADGSIQTARQQLQERFAAGSGWGPSQAIEAIARTCPSDVVVTLDSGAHRILTSQKWACSEPQTLLQSTCLCTMGCALPLAAGYKLAARDRPVIAIMGDGCLDMTLGELATLRDLMLPVVVVVFVDGSLSLIEMKQRDSGKQNLAVDFPMTDYAAIAMACGGRGSTVETTVDLERELKEAFEAKTFTLIAVRIPRRAYDGLI